MSSRLSSNRSSSSSSSVSGFDLDLCIGLRRGRDENAELVDWLRLKVGGFFVDFVILDECAAENLKLIMSWPCGGGGSK